MAGVNTPRPVPIPAAMFAGRFVFDVMKYTLAKCGLPQVEKIRTTLEPNPYNRPDFVKIAGISSLRIALIMRDNWRQMFISRYQSSGLVGLDVPLFMSQIVKLCIFGRGKCLQSDVETILAFCHELTLFYFSKRMDYDINNVIGSVGGSMYFLLREHENFRETLEGLFDKFDNLREYSKFLSNFIRRVAIPYGFRDNVSDLFYQEIKRRRIDYVARVACQEEPFKALIDHLGFLPLELYTAIAAEEAEKWPEHLEEITESHPLVAGNVDEASSESGAVGGQMPSHRQSDHSKKTSEESRPTMPDPTKSHARSESGGVEKRSEGTQSTTVSEQSQQSTTKPSELGTEDTKLPEHSESACAPTSAVAGESILPSTPPADSESGAVGRKKPRRRRSSRSKTTPEKSMPTLPDHPPISQAISEGCDVEKKKSDGRRLTAVSEQTSQRQQSIAKSSEMEIEAALGRMNLGAAEKSQQSQGTIPKRKSHQQEKLVKK